MKSRNREFLLLAAFFVGGYFWLFSEKEDLLQKEKSFQFFSTIATNELIKQYPAPPDHLALQSAVVINLQTDYTYLEVQPKKAWPLASLTKILTAIVAFEHLPSSEERDLLVKQMMVVSSNEAAEKLASLYGKEEFLSLMRRKTLKLQMKNTSIDDVSGLSPNNQSTINDLVRLAHYTLQKHPKIFQLSRETNVVIDDKIIESNNDFVGRKDFLGGKTGYTNEASGNLLSLFEYHGQPILIIVLGTESKAARFYQTNILFEWISKFYN